MDSLNDIWKKVLALCKNEVSDVMYNMWLVPLEFYKLEDDTAVFTVNADFRKTIIITKFAPLLKKCFAEVIGFEVEIDVMVEKAIELETNFGNSTMYIMSSGDNRFSFSP